LADDDRRRAEEAEEAKRREAEAEAERQRSAAAAPVGAAEDEAPRKAHGHGHPKPPPARDDRSGGKAKPTRGSHAMVAGVEDDDSAARFAGQLHLSAADRARRSTARPKARPQRGGQRDHQARSGTGF